MDRVWLLHRVYDIFKRAGFELADICASRSIGFDIIARKDKRLVIVKVLTNIDSFSENVAHDLKTLASLLRASLLLIGEREGTTYLEDDVIYFRNGVQTITANTLENHLLGEIPIQVYAAPGGFYASLNGKRIREIREKKNLSRGELARMIHVSRKAIRLYEEGMDARVEIAAALEEILHPSVIDSLDILRPVEPMRIHRRIGDMGWLYSFQREILSLMEKIGYRVIPMHRCPFEAISKEKKSNMLFTMVQRYDSTLKERARIIKGIARITEKHAVIFTDKYLGSKKSVEGTPLIRREELKRIRDPREILNMIVDREK